ncbi:MAG: caspase family protein [Pyrinomonadaceae bacterium]|nr:caspase family protein [Pyrinomonadaceae bacterium]
MNQKKIKKYLLLFLIIFSPVFLTAKGEFDFDVQTKISEASPNKPELVMQTGHNLTISAVLFSPDNKWAATGSFDNTIKIWETATGRELRVLSGHAGVVKALAWSFDGQFLASASTDRTIKLWNVETGHEMRTLTGHADLVETVAFTGDGQKLASGSADKTIKIWETATGRELKTLPEGASALAWSFDNRLLASGGADNSVKIWEIDRDKKPRVLKNHTDRIKTLAWSADNQMLASGSADKTVRIWKTSNGRELYNLTNHTDKVLAVNFLNNGEIVSADANHTIKVWNLATGRETRTVAEKNNVDGYNQAEAAAFSSDARLAIFGHGDRTATIVNTEDGTRLQNLQNRTGGFNAVAFSPDEHWLAAGSIDNTIKLWDLQTGQNLPPLVGHTGYVRCVLFHPDKRRIISGGLDHSIKIWNFTTGDAPQTLGEHAQPITSMAISRQGKWLASGSVDRTIKLWDLASLKETRVFTGHTGEVTSVAVSPDETTIASGSVDRTVKLWNLNDASKEPLTLVGHAETVQAITFSPDGKLLASAGSDKVIKIWDAATARLLSTLSGNSGKIFTLAFSPDGQKLVSGGEDKTIRVWNIAAGREEKSLDGHFGTVNSIDFSADGKWLASASDDGSVNLWRTETGGKLATLLALRENNDWLVVSPEGFFDGSPTGWNQLLWRFSGSTFNVSPVEVFFNEFYQPGLLADLLEGKQFSATGDISQKDRRQPQLKISAADKPNSTEKISARHLRIKIEVSEAAANGGARDVRLFRNGSLVKFWGGDVLANRRGTAELETTVPIIQGLNQFTAYAFNRDNIKSSDANLTVTGADNLKKQGTIYIVAIGVGQYANPEFNLSYIEADVRDFGEMIQLKQSELASGEQIKVFPLLNEQATKNNILETLQRLAGTKTDKKLPSPLPFDAEIQPVQPEDTVVVYFSGHGISHDNQFYMIPHDIGYQGKRSSLSPAGLKEILAHSISDVEMEESFRGIDAKNLLLILDACNSGQALEAPEKRRGPMNSKGLAQLAYEKGMYILTASQSVESAYVSQTLKHSYLTYALVEEGLKSAVADTNPADGQLLLREWFEYASRRVSLIREEEISNLTKAEQAKKLTEVTVKTGGGTQRPRVFYRKQIERQPMVVARFPTAKQ